MKYALILFFSCLALKGSAQYNKEKLVNILTGGSIKSWSVKGTNIELPEKSYSFNINGSMQIQKDQGKGQPDKWSIYSKDNIRWFLLIGSQEHEIIISFDKNGNQYIKLTHQAIGNNTSVYYETILHPLK